MSHNPLTRLVWIVTPHADGGYDEWWGPADSEEDHGAALAYALARLEDLACECDADGPTATVTIRCETVNAEDFELSQEPAP